MKERAKELRDAGNTIRYISRRLGIPTSLVNYYLNPDACSKLAWARILVLEAGMSASEVTEILNIGPNTLQTYIGDTR